MFSGSDSTESQHYTQWALNPSAYQNMSNEQVDWAALAQQWIIMKEAAIEPPIQKQLTAPPPPIISKQKKEFTTEGGEAPMEVVNDDDTSTNWDSIRSNESFPWNQSLPEQQPWNWSSTWSSNSSGNPPTSVKAPLLPTPSYNTYTSVKEPAADTNYGYNSVSQTTAPGYWSSTGSSKVIKPYNKRYSKVNVPIQSKPTPSPPATTMTLDAAKRKQLPAWIREGLEKMERDKLKQVDKGKEKHEKIEYEDKIKLRENALEILKSTVKQPETKRLSVYDDDSDEDTPPRRASPIPQTYEDMMLKVRRTMTEILLKVTNREIQNICKEELQRHVRKLKASDQRVSAPSGANLIAKLGLGAYEGSGDSSDESDDNSNQGYQDSDSELRDVIRRRKEEFVKIERAIEDRLADVEHKDNSRASTPDSDSQVDALSQERKSRRSEEGTPPPKPNSYNSKTLRRQQSSHSSDSDNDLNSKSSKSKDRRSRGRSSSSEQYRRSKRSRSPSPVSRKRNTVSRRSRSNSHRRDTRIDRRSCYSRSRSRSRSRSYRKRSNRSRSRKRTDSRSPYRKSRSRSRSHSSRRYRRSRSYSNGRGKRSNRH